MRNIAIVMKHEFLTTLSKRSFWVMTFLLPGMIILFSFGSQLLAETSFNGEQLAGEISNQAPAAVGYIDDADLIQKLPPGYSPDNLKQFPDEAAAQAAMDSGEIMQYYVIPSDAIENGQISLIVRDYAPFNDSGSYQIIDPVLQFNLVKDEELALLINDPAPDINQHMLAPESSESPNQEGPISDIVPYAIIMIFFMLISMTGSLMLTSVSKEKENRTVEVLLLSLQPRDLMAGKLLGLSAVALLQVSIWLSAMSIGLRQAKELLHLATSFEMPTGLFAWGLAFLLLGYLMYASAQGVLGALAPTAREGAQFSLIVLLPLIIPMMLNTIFVEDPTGGIVTFLSLFPLTAPVSMIARMTVVDVPLWQTILSLLGVGVVAYEFVLISARLFRADTLLSSSALSWKRLGQELKHSLHKR